MEKRKQNQEPYELNFTFKKTTKKEIIFTNTPRIGKNYVLLNKRFKEIKDGKELVSLHE